MVTVDMAGVISRTIYTDGESIELVGATVVQNKSKKDVRISEGVAINNTDNTGWILQPKETAMVSDEGSTYIANVFSVDDQQITIQAKGTL